NSGLLTLEGGGDFKDFASITNFGTIEVAGGTLNVGVGIANADATHSGLIQIDGGATLSFSADAGSGASTLARKIDGGTVTIAGTLDLEGSVSLQNGSLGNSGLIDVFGSGNALDNETVTNGGQIIVEAGAVLTLDLGTSITDGLLTNAGTIDVETSGATFDNADIDNSDGTIQVDGPLMATTTLLLADDTSITNGNVTVGPVGILEVSAGSDVSLTNVILDNGNLVQVDADAILTLDGTTISGGRIADNGTISIDSDQTLKLSGVALDGGEIDNSGTVEITATSSIDGDIFTNATLKIDADQTLTLDDTTITGGSITDNGTIAVDADDTLKLSGVALDGGKIDNSGTVEITATSSIDDDIFTNTTLKIDADQTLTLDNTTITGGNVANGGTVNVDADKTLTLNNATISGGIVSNDGTINSTGGGVIEDADITNIGLIESTVGIMAIDPNNQTFTLTNSGTVEANGGELDITGEQIANTEALKAVGGGTLKLSGLTVTNTGGTVTVDNASALDLTSANITGGNLNNAGTFDSLSGNNIVSAAVDNTGTIEVKAGTLDLAGGLTGGGTVIIDAGATLELAGADAETITFEGGADTTTTLTLDSTAIPFTGTISGNATTGGTFEIDGQGSITTTSGDAIDFNASNGTDTDPANVTVTLGGTITGAANGIAVIQNGIGDVTVDTSGAVTGKAGYGILAEISATGTGNIVVDATGKVSGSGAGIDGLLAENLDPSNSGTV